MSRAVSFFCAILCAFCLAVIIVPSRIPAQTSTQTPLQSAAPPAASGKETITVFDGWNVRYGIAALEAKMPSLIEKPEVFAVDATLFKDEFSGEYRVYGSGEVHALFPLPLDAMVAVLIDLANMHAISPKVAYVKIIDACSDHWMLYENIVIAFLGLGVDYRFSQEVCLDTLSDGAMGLRGRLVRSFDEKLYCTDSSWYLKRIKIDDKDYTYVRYWATTGLRRETGLAVSILKTFTPGEIRDNILALAHLAAKLGRP